MIEPPPVFERTRRTSNVGHSLFQDNGSTRPISKRS